MGFEFDRISQEPADREEYERWQREQAAEQMRAVVEQRDALLAALKDFMRSACRYGDDGKFDDMFDASRQRAREIIASVEAIAKAKGTP